MPSIRLIWMLAALQALGSEAHSQDLAEERAAILRQFGSVEKVIIIFKLTPFIMAFNVMDTGERRSWDPDGDPSLVDMRCVFIRAPQLREEPPAPTHSEPILRDSSSEEAYSEEQPQLDTQQLYLQPLQSIHRHLQ